MADWDFLAYEAQNGLRFSWNEWPSTTVEAARIVVPIACLCVHRGPPQRRAGCRGRVPLLRLRLLRRR